MTKKLLGDSVILNCQALGDHIVALVALRDGNTQLEPLDTSTESEFQLHQTVWNYLTINGRCCRIEI